MRPIAILLALGVTGCASAGTAPAPRAASPSPRVAVAPADPPRERPRRGNVTLDVTDAPVGAVLAEIGRQIERPVVLEPGASVARVTLSVRDAPWRPVVEFLARNAKLDLREERRALVFRARETNLVAASGADGKTLARLLAEKTGRSIVIAPGVEGDVDLLLRDVSWDTALRVTVEAMGCEVVEVEDEPTLINSRQR